MSKSEEGQGRDVPRDGGRDGEARPQTAEDVEVSLRCDVALQKRARAVLKSLGTTLYVILDLFHVLEYLGQAASFLPMSSSHGKPSYQFNRDDETRAYRQARKTVLPQRALRPDTATSLRSQGVES